MTDRECVEFLQWALPQLGLRWPGFRKVRRQVHKRIVRRLNELGLTQIAEYRECLRANSDEWSVLDGFTRISISRFYRDRDVFTYFDEQGQQYVLERLAGRLVSGGYLVIGKHENLPSGTQGLLPYLQQLGVYRRV